MRVLAIDTALDACAAAVLDTGRGGIIAHETLALTRGHAEALMPLIARVMDAAAIAFADLDRIAVTVGPGIFTGLRVGVAAARGIALAAAKPAVGLTTLAALAAPVFEADENNAVLAVVNARHDRVYMQLFGPGGQSLAAPRVASPPTWSIPRSSRPSRASTRTMATDRPDSPASRRPWRSET